MGVLFYDAVKSYFYIDGRKKRAGGQRFRGDVGKKSSFLCFYLESLEPGDVCRGEVVGSGLQLQAQLTVSTHNHHQGYIIQEIYIKE